MTIIISTMSQMFLLVVVFMLASVICRDIDNKRQDDGSNPPATLCGRRPAITRKRSLETKGSSDGDDSEDLDKLTGGDLVSHGQIPWIVNIVTSFVEDPKCAGVIISKHWILTSYACVNPNDTRGYSMIVGDNFFYGGDQNERSYTYKKIVLHGTYSGTPDYDIALIKVNGSGIRFNNYVQPICLPVAGETPPVGATLTLAGWGHDKQRSRMNPGLLKSKAAGVISKANCTRLYGEGFITSRVMCVREQGNTTGVCEADSGGPVYYQSGDIYILAGILSTPLAGCRDLDQGAAFANILKYTQWITNNINRYSSDTEKVLPNRTASTLDTSVSDD